MEIYNKDLVKELNWNETFNEGGSSYNSPDLSPYSSSSNVISNQRIVGSALNGCSFTTSGTGARVNILKDPHIGLEMFDLYENSIFKFYVGGPNVADLIIGNVDTENYIQWDNSAGTLTVRGDIIADLATIGGFDIGEDYIRDTANTFGLASTVTAGDDIRIWGGASFANRASANFYITESGEALFKYVTISGGSNVKFISDTLNTESKKILKDFTFEIDNDDHYVGAFKSGDIVWDEETGDVVSGSGIVWHAGGIIGANDGNETFSINASTGDATFAGTLSAAGGSLGVITTGLITLDSTGYIRGGATGYMTGTGFFLGYDTDAYKFRVGTATEYIAFDGASFEFTVPMVSPHYFKAATLWKTGDATFDGSFRINKGYSLWCVTCKDAYKPTYYYAVMGGLVDSQYPSYKVSIMRYAYNASSGEYAYDGTNSGTDLDGGTLGDQKVYGIAHIGSYIYVLRRQSNGFDPATWYIRRYNENLTNPTNMTGWTDSNPATTIFTDGTYLFVYHTGTIQKFSISGTTITDEDDDITVTLSSRFVLGGEDYFYEMANMAGTGYSLTNCNLKRYEWDGTLDDTKTLVVSGGSSQTTPAFETSAALYGGLLFFMDSVIACGFQNTGKGLIAGSSASITFHLLDYGTAFLEFFPLAKKDF